jgi:uncharacterized membrane protein YphA (DoxX/SURF4 family)
MGSRSSKGVAIVRILTGIVFIAEGWAKVAGAFVRGGFAESVRETASGRAWPFWSSFLRGFVAAHARPFGWFFALAELALGLALLLGLLTRPATAGGVVLMLILLLGQTNAAGSSWDQWITAGLTAKFALLLLCLLFLADAGRVWGVDATLRKRPRPLRTR